ncbi:hypothetical protein CYMTET_3340 [Cymbomonas tetramitiformis]|uniref:Uncharacterized protein n=1 Tax=Cymbomonas tetramitiformis TaxID=36881 RepID=A0AAE0H3P1_9CHLO|nr:hypothetical protein CYMTET_3340 [Cymbomonas tetramitiformis]
MECLDLSFNKIRSVVGLNRIMGSVSRLILSWNELTSTRSLDLLPAIEGLDLRSNLISDMEEVARLSRLPYLEALWLEGNPLALALPSYRAAVLSNFKDPRSMLLDGRRCGATTLANAIRLAARNQRKSPAGLPPVPSAFTSPVGAQLRAPSSPTSPSTLLPQSPFSNLASSTLATLAQSGTVAIVSSPNTGRPILRRRAAPRVAFISDVIQSPGGAQKEGSPTDFAQAPPLGPPEADTAPQGGALGQTSSVQPAASRDASAAGAGNVDNDGQGAVGEGAITPSRWELTGERLRRQVDVLQREGGRSWLGIWDDFLQGEEHSRRAPSTSFVTPAATGTRWRGSGAHTASAGTAEAGPSTVGAVPFGATPNLTAAGAGSITGSRASWRGEAASGSRGGSDATSSGWRSSWMDQLMSKLSLKKNAASREPPRYESSVLDGVQAMAGCTIAGYDTEEEEDRTEAGHRAIEGPEEESELDTTSEDSDSDQSEMGRQERCRAPTSPAMSAVSTTSVARARAQDGKEARMEGSRGNACDAAPSARGAESLDTPPLDIGAESPGTPPLDIPRPRGDSRGDFSLEPLCEAGHGAGGSLPEAREHRHRRRNSAHRSIDFDQCSEGEEEVSSRSYVEEASRPLDGTHLRAEATEGRQRVEAGVEGFFKGPSVVGADPGEARRERASGMAGARGQQWGTWDGAVRWRAAVRSSAIPSLRHKYTDLTPIPLAELPEPAPAQQQQHSAEGAATSATPLPPRHDSSVHCRAATDFPGGTASALASPDGGQTASSPDQAATSMQLPESGTVGAGSPPKGEDTARGALPSGSLGAQGFASGHGYDVSVGEPRGRDGRGYAEVQSPRSPVIKRDSALGLPEGMWEEMQARGAARGGAGSPVPGARVAVTMRSGDAAGGSAAVSREDHVAEGEGEPVAMGEDMGTVKAVEPGAGDICARTSSAGGTEAEEAAVSASESSRGGRLDGADTASPARGSDADGHWDDWDAVSPAMRADVEALTECTATTALPEIAPLAVSSRPFGFSVGHRSALPEMNGGPAHQTGGGTTSSAMKLGAVSQAAGRDSTLDAVNDNAGDHWDDWDATSPAVFGVANDDPGVSPTSAGANIGHAASEGSAGEDVSAEHSAGACGVGGPSDTSPCPPEACVEPVEGEALPVDQEKRAEAPAVVAMAARTGVRSEKDANGSMGAPPDTPRSLEEARNLSVMFRLRIAKERGLESCLHYFACAYLRGRDKGARKASQAACEGEQRVVLLLSEVAIYICCFATLDVLCMLKLLDIEDVMVSAGQQMMLVVDASGDTHTLITRNSKLTASITARLQEGRVLASGWKSFGIRSSDQQQLQQLQVFSLRSVPAVVGGARPAEIYIYIMLFYCAQHNATCASDLAAASSAAAHLHKPQFTTASSMGASGCTLVLTSSELLLVREAFTSYASFAGEAVDEPYYMLLDRCRVCALCRATLHPADAARSGGEEAPDSDSRKAAHWCREEPTAELELVFLPSSSSPTDGPHTPALIGADAVKSPHAPLVASPVRWVMIGSEIELKRMLPLLKALWQPEGPQEELHICIDPTP